MIRLLGAVLVAAASAWLGLSAAAELGRRVRRLEALSAALELLERELWERGAPLPEVFQALAREPFPAAWRRLVDGLEGVPREGRAALLPLGEVLGRYEAQGQREAIAQSRSALERARRRAEEEKARMGRVYQALGLTGGGFLVILLL